jgi:hypothetical protein
MTDENKALDFAAIVACLFVFCLMWFLVAAMVREAGVPW